MAVVCLSVCPVPDPKSRMEGHRKLKIGRKEARDTGDHNPTQRSKGQGYNVTSAYCGGRNTARLFTHILQILRQPTIVKRIMLGEISEKRRPGRPHREWLQDHV